MNVQYWESVQSHEQFKGVLIGTVHHKLLNGAGLLLRT
jgi:hypothetical protein